MRMGGRVFGAHLLQLQGDVRFQSTILAVTGGIDAGLLYLWSCCNGRQFDTRKCAIPASISTVFPLLVVLGAFPANTSFVTDTAFLVTYIMLRGSFTISQSHPG